MSKTMSIPHKTSLKIQSFKVKWDKNEKDGICYSVTL